MAVEIPVIIDIDKAFEDAASRVSAAIKPIQRSLSDNALDIKLGTVEIDENKVDVTLRRIKEEGAETFGGLSQLIDIANKRLVDLAASGNSVDFKSMLEVKHYLADMATASQVAESSINGLANSLSGIKANISAARTTLETAPINSEEWKSAAIALERYKSELKDTEEAIRQISVDQAKVDFSLYIDRAAEKVSLLEDSVKRLSSELKGFMTKKEMTLFKADPSEIDNYKRAAQALREAQDALNKMSGFQDHIRELSTVNIELLQMREHYRKLEEESRKMSTSIEGYQIRLNEINEKWRQLTAEQKYTSDGKMTAEARSQYDTYKRLTLEMQKQAAELDRIFEKEQRRAQKHREIISNRKREQAILNATTNSISVLQAKEQVLSDRLSKAVVGSSKYEQLKKQLEAVRAELDKINGKSIKEVGDEAVKADSKLASLIKNSIRLVALHAGASFVRNVREVTAEFELQRVALGSIIQDTERAESLFRQIKAAAIQSPFEIKDLVSYTKQLSAYQIETDKLFDTTMKLADVSAGLGVDMGRLILAYGQVRAAAVLRGQELRQFTEAGIPLVDKLAEKFKKLRGDMVSTGEVFQLISERAVPFSMIEEIFNDMTSAGGMFYKMQEKQAQTLAGQWANLKDSLSIMYDEIGNTQAVHGAMEVLIKDARYLMQNWRALATAVKIVGAGYVSYVGLAKVAALWTARNATAAAQAAVAESIREKNLKKLTAALLTKSAALKVVTLATDLHTYAMTRATAATNAFAAAFWRLTAALATNPFGALVAALGVLIGLYATLRTKTRDISKDIDNARASIESLNKTTGETRDLINQYEELASKTSLNTEETKKLKDVTRELSRVFPKAVEGINEQTGALTLNLSKLRQYNEEAEKATRKGMEAMLRVNERDIKKNQKKIERLSKENNRGWGRNAAVSLVSPVITPLSDKQYTENAIAIGKLQSQNEELIKTNQELRNSLDGVSDSAGSETKKLLSWQSKLIEFNSRTDAEGNKIVTLSNDQIEGYTRLEDALEDLAKQYKDESESVSVLEKALIGKNQEETKDILLALERTKARRDLIKEELDYYNAFYLTMKKTSSSASGTDPFVTNMQNRIKFMQDFKKGYDDLNRYMSSSEAQMEEANIMLGRGQSLGLGPDEQLRAVNDLSKWYEDMLKKVQDKLRAKGLKGTDPTDFLSVDTAKKGKAIQDLQKLLQQLWDAKTDYDTSKKKKEIEDALKQLSDEIKQTETARNFYQDILDLTGDEQLAATLGVSIYGNMGQDFKDRLQQQLNEAMKTLDASALTDEMRTAFANQDFETILANLDKFPEEWRSRLKEMAADSYKFQADRAKDLLKALAGAKTYAEQQVELAKQTAKRTAQIQAMKVKDDVKNQLLKQNARKEAEESAKIAYEAFKDTPMYIELFSDLDAASLRMLTNMRENLAKMKDNWKNLQPRELKELQSRLNELDEQIAQRNPFKALANSIKAYRDLQKQRSTVEVEEAAIAANQRLQSEEELLQVYREEYLEVEALGKDHEAEAMVAKEKMEIQQQAVDAAKEEADAAQQTAYEYKNAKKHIQDAAEKMQEWAGYVTDSLGGIQQIVGTFASDDTAETFDIIAEGLGKTVSGAAELGQGIAKLVNGDLSGIVDTIRGLGDVVAGTFGTKNQLNIKKLNKKIDEQQTLLDGLTYSYDRLEKAMAKAFGSDYIYNYNEQLKNLQAQQAAYEEQARLESQKGKKRDKKKEAEYRESAKEVQDQINDMQGMLSEAFTGSDLKSAAEEFANSWIEAYKSFSSTTGAMQAKFQDMIGNMITQSLAGQMMQSLLQPIFEEIDRLAKDGELTATDIAAISEMATAAIPQIDAAMTGLVNNLAGAGINLRQQAGQFTGISRDIAGASEESILGLAAAVNTANFYISHVPTISENVAAIREVLTGEAVPGRRNTAATRGDVEGPTYEDQMLAYAASIPLMRDDTATIRALLERVIKPVGTTATHYVSIR